MRIALCTVQVPFCERWSGITSVIICIMRIIKRDYEIEYIKNPL